MFHPYQKFEKLEERGKIIIKQKCTRPENEFYRSVLAEGEELPEGIRQFMNKDDEPTGKFYKILDDGMTSEELTRYVLLLQHNELRTIRKTLKWWNFMKILKAIGFVAIVAFCVIGSIVGVHMMDNLGII